MNGSEQNFHQPGFLSCVKPQVNVYFCDCDEFFFFFTIAYLIRVRIIVWLQIASAFNYLGLQVCSAVFKVSMHGKIIDFVKHSSELLIPH